MNLFLELWRNGKLANRRHPMYEKSKFAHIIFSISVLFWIGYLVFFALFFSFTLQNEAVEPYHLINSIMWLFLLIDFVMRFPFQKMPTQEVKPYLLLPIRRKRLIDMLLIRSGMSLYNLFWLWFYIPFALLTVARFYGLTGVLTYSTGMWLLMLVNNYWYLLCRTLMAYHIAWIALPLGLYGLLFLSLILPDTDFVFYFFLDLGEAFITGQLPVFLAVAAAIGMLGWLNHHFLQKTLYNELNKVEDTTIQVRKLSEYHFLDRFGLVGEYIRLELKLLLRNKICRNQLYMVLAVTLMFSLILGFTDTYSGLSKDFFIIYNFQLMGVMFLSPLMSYEGNYIDGLMSRKESIYTLLCAKYIVYSLGQLLPFLLLIPGMINGSIPLTLCLAWLCFVPGPIYYILFQMAVFNNRTIHLNVNMMSRRNAGSGMQSLISGASFFVPFAIYALISLLVGEAYAPWVLMLIGIVFIILSPWWLKNIYRRFMKRRYQNLEGFHNSREKL